MPTPGRGGSRYLLLVASAGAIALAAWLVAGRTDRAPTVAGSGSTARPGSDASRPAPVGWSDAGVRARERRVVARRRATAADEGAAGTEHAGAAPPRAPREIDAGEYIAALRAGGETEGLAAFPPPGTNPPRSGVVVPEDYVLPEGFARHYQTTDDGRQLAPVLAVAPEYDLVDESGHRIELRGDRIVPPELAPPDLPVRMLEVPETPARGSDAR